MNRGLSILVTFFFVWTAVLPAEAVVYCMMQQSTSPCCCCESSVKESPKSTEIESPCCDVQSSDKLAEQTARVLDQTSTSVAPSAHGYLPPQSESADLHQPRITDSGLSARGPPGVPKYTLHCSYLI